MKRWDLERRLRELGWRLLRHGARHDVWWNGKDPDVREYIPRHSELGEGIAAKILKRARDLKAVE